jgi:hypothetical protein
MGVVDEDRHAGFQIGTDEQACAAHVPLGQRFVLRGELGHDRRDDRSVERAEAEVIQREQVRDRRGELIGRRARGRAQAPIAPQVVPIECPDVRLRVSNVHGEQHARIITTAIG